MTSMSCPPAQALSRALITRESPILEHVGQCADCNREWHSLLAIDELARRLPQRQPDAQQQARARASLVASADRTLPARRLAARSASWAVFSVAAMAALALGASLLRGRWREASSATYHAEITAEPGALYSRVSAAPDEVVRLRSGTLELDVSPLSRGERFRVLAGAGEVEVRGTRFQVSVSDDQLRSVHVVHGAVEVRQSSHLLALVTAGQAWHAEGAAPSPPAVTGHPVPALPAVASGEKSLELSRRPLGVQPLHSVARTVQQSVVSESAEPPVSPPPAAPEVSPQPSAVPIPSAPSSRLPLAPLAGSPVAVRQPPAVVEDARRDEQRERREEIRERRDQKNSRRPH